MTVSATTTVLGLRETMITKVAHHLAGVPWASLSPDQQAVWRQRAIALIGGAAAFLGKNPTYDDIMSLRTAATNFIAPWLTPTGS